MGIRSWVAEKLNPAQILIGGIAESSTVARHKATKPYENLGIVNRCINMLVDDAASVNYNVGNKIYGLGKVIITKPTLEKLINVSGNPYQDLSALRRNILIDLIIDGNAFIYYDGIGLYHLPANKVSIEKSKTEYVSKYTFNNETDYSPKEIIHIKDNSADSIYRGTSRLKSTFKNIDLVDSMQNFQDTFFSNGAVPGLVIESPHVLGKTVKERMLQHWSERYNPKSGGRKPIILDGGLNLKEIGSRNFRELDFDESLSTHEEKICEGLGIPPILLAGGNNANIRPNLRLYYLQTVLPIVKKINSAFSHFFGYEVTEDVANVVALQPELSEQAGYHTSLVNGGVITPNEARIALGYDELEGLNEIRIPQNIAGSAADPSEGGRPSESEDE